MTSQNKKAPAPGQRDESRMEIVGTQDNKAQDSLQASIIGHEIMINALALGELSSQLNDEQWKIIRLVKRNLLALAEYATELEKNLVAIHE